MTSNVQGCTSSRFPGRPRGGWDYTALVDALRFEDPGVWTRADKRGRVPLYQACALYLGIAEDGEPRGEVPLLQNEGGVLSLQKNPTTPNPYSTINHP